MAISFSCDQCGKRYNTDDSLAGKRIKCKGCGTSVTIPSPQDDAFDRYGLDEDEPPAPKHGGGDALLPRAGAGRRSSPNAGAPSSGIPAWVWLVGGAVGLLLIVLVLAALLGGRSRGPQVAQDEPAPAGTGAEEDETPTAGTFRRDEVSASAAAPRSSWQVKADPAPEKIEFPPLAKLEITIPPSYSSDDVLYPTTPSAFVILGGNNADDHYREVWDLRTATAVGRLSGRLEVAAPMALSPDGAYFVCHTNPVPRTTDIWRIADARRIGQIQDGDRIPDVIEFAGPNRVVIGNTSAQDFQVWDVAAGKPVASFKAPGRVVRDSVALSPGRRFMALLLGSKNQIQVYDLTTGRLAGEIAMAKDGSYDFDCDGMAFSPDGTALAGLFTAITSTHLMCWDATTGTLESAFRSEGNNAYGNVQEPQAVQWLPDQSGWLINNQTFVERKSGQTVWSMPFDPVRPQDRGPRKVLDAGRMVAVGRVRGNKALGLVPLPAEKIQAAISLARGGGSAVDALLPPLATADRSAAKTVAPPSGPVAWTAFRDPAPVAKAAPARPITLRVEALDIVSLLVAGTEMSQALVVSSPKARITTNQGQQGQQPRQVDRYDLAGGRPLGRFEIPSVSLPMALSPEGTHVLVSHAGAADRLDIHAAADGKHLVGWRPFAEATGDARNVAWADFLDAGRVLTVNSAGTLILWSLPDCKAVYVADQALQGIPLLSPGRKALALLRGGTLRLIDPATGAPLGDASGAGYQAETGLKAAGFDPEGQELAAVLGDTLVRWDLNTGQVVGEIPALGTKAGSLQYGNARHVLLDGTLLYDLENRRTVWKYEGGEHATAGPAGRHWAAAGAISGPAQLGAIAIPTEAIARLEAAAADPKTQALLGAGATVSVQVEGSPPRDAEAFRSKLVDGLTARLQAVGVQVADGRPVRLVVRFQEKETGGTMELRKFSGTGQPEVRKFPSRAIDWERSVTDGRGNPIVLDKGTIAPRMFGFERLPPGDDDWEGFWRTQQWQAGATELAARDLPFFVARGPSGPVVLPGTTSLGYPSR